VWTDGELMTMSEDYEGATEIERAWREGLTPDPLLTVSEWSDRHRMLSSKASAEPGRWRTSRTPYLQEIMDSLSPTSPVERVVFMKGVQIGATECGCCWIGYVIHHAPGPMMAVWPTVEMAKRNSKQRIDPLIEESAVLQELISPARSRDSGNTILAKEFRGGVLVMTGANSAVGLRSMPVRYLFLDEVDGYPLDVEGEGDAIALAEARTRTFARRKILIVSTPTIAGASAIEREYEASDQRRYFVPCPHCSHWQWLRFEQLRWDKGQPETAAYICEHCEDPIAEHHKTVMLEQGEWRAMAPENGAKTAGFHLSSLYSPVGWRSWSDIAAAWERAVDKESGSAAAIKTFKNTELGETWVEDGEAPDWQRLVERREDYPVGSVPAGGLLLVGSADVQKDRIEASVWAYGRGKEAWLVEHRVLMGDTARDAVWKRLAEMIAETWTHASGAQMPLARFALDTGFATQEAYAFVRACHDPRVMAVKGVTRGAALIGTPTAVEVTRGGKKLRRGIKLYAVAVGIAKLEFYNNLRKAPEVGEDGEITRYPVGYVHLPKVDAEFIQQLCAEQLVTRRDRNGFPVREWQKMRERNEALDCYVYGRAAAAAAGLDRFEERHWRELERQLGVERPPDEPPPDPAPQAPEPQEATHRGGLAVSGPRTHDTRTAGRRVIKSRWLTR
jgi:phage terminase large subunit GpA-like protein